MKLEQLRKDAIAWLLSIGVKVENLSEERILLAMFLATNPSIEQLYICTTLIMNERDKI